MEYSISGTPIGADRDSVKEGFPKINSITCDTKKAVALFDAYPHIRETASWIDSNNLSERIPVPRQEDELSDLARLLNLMFDRLESAFN